MKLLTSTNLILLGILTATFSGCANQAEWDSVNSSLQNFNNSMQNNIHMQNQRTESLRQQNYQYMNNSNNSNKNLYYMQQLTPNLYYVK